MKTRTIFLLALSLTIAWGAFSWCVLGTACANAQRTQQPLQQIVRPVSTSAVTS